MTWSEARSLFPILKNYTYFNTARFCALPQPVVDLQSRYVGSLSEHGSWEFGEWIEKYEQARALAAELMSCPVDATFFLPNVSTGINLASLYLPNRPVVLMETDFPSVLLPWQTNRHPIEMVPNDDGFYSRLEPLMAEGRKILSISWVQSADGFEIDLPRIFDWCKRYDCTIILDGTQGLGAIPFEVDPDVSMVFLSSSFKWLLAGYGVAIGYVSEDLLPTFKAFQGWNSIDFGSGMAKTGAASLEVGNALFFNVLGLHEGLQLITKLGIDAITQRNIRYRDQLIEALTAANFEVKQHPSSRSTIFQLMTKDGDYELMVKDGIQTSKQRGKVRLSPHFYNDENDIDRLLSVLRSN